MFSDDKVQQKQRLELIKNATKGLTASVRPLTKSEESWQDSFARLKLRVDLDVVLYSHFTRLESIAI